MGLTYKYFADHELAKFKEFQQRSYATLEAVAAELKVGMTEVEVARRLRKRFHEQGVHTYFHVPVVLFGDRTAYPGDFGQLEALSTERKLEKDQAIILDAAPIYEGYIVDTSLSTVFGENATHKMLHPKLKAFRDQILSQVKEGVEFRDIENSCNQMIEEMGAENCHRKHIGEVIGHRVFKVKKRFWHAFTIKQISVRHVVWLFWKSLAAVKGWQNDSPNWNHRRTSAHKPFPGLWAVEPHFAIDGIGVKFEEILVVTDDDAYWLDDDLPHVKAWAKAA
jgi:Xaa-Pro aminopeptidase